MPTFIPHGSPSGFALPASQDWRPIRGDAGCRLKPWRRKATLHYAYVIKRIPAAGQRCIGLTADPRRRTEEHNAGKSAHAAKFRPLRSVAYVAFSDHEKAMVLERHFKTESHKAFAYKRFW